MRFAKRLKGRISAGTPQLSPTICHFTGTPVLIRYYFSPPIRITSFRIWAQDDDGVTDVHGTTYSRLQAFIQPLNPDLGLSLSLPPPAQVPEYHTSSRGGESQAVGAAHQACRRYEEELGLYCAAG